MHLRVGVAFRHWTGSTIRIIVGSGGVSQKGWIATDRDTLDLLGDADWEQHFRGLPVDAIMAEHVWEHLTEKDGLDAAINCFHHIREGGYIRLAVPDGLHPSAEYRDAVRPGGYGLGSDDHRVLYDYRSLTRVLERAGFRVRPLEYFDEVGGFHEAAWASSASQRPHNGLLPSRKMESGLCVPCSSASNL
jgi:predicted SAM-dependent methyltransferase